MKGQVLNMKSKIEELRDFNRQDMKNIDVLAMCVNLLKNPSSAKLFGCQFDTRVATFMDDVFNNPLMNAMMGVGTPPPSFFETMKGKIISSMLTELWDEDRCKTHYFSVDTMKRSLQIEPNKENIKNINKLKEKTFYIDIARCEDQQKEKLAKQRGIDPSMIKWIDGMIIHFIRNDNSDTIHFIEAGLCINLEDMEEDKTSMVYITIDMFDIDWNNLDEYRQVILKNCIYLANNHPLMRIKENNFFYDPVEIKS